MRVYIVPSKTFVAPRTVPGTTLLSRPLQHLLHTPTVYPSRTFPICQCLQAQSTFHPRLCCVNAHVAAAAAVAWLLRILCDVSRQTCSVQLTEAWLCQQRLGIQLQPCQFDRAQAAVTHACSRYQVCFEMCTYTHSFGQSAWHKGAGRRVRGATRECHHLMPPYTLRADAAPGCNFSQPVFDWSTLSNNGSAWFPMSALLP